MEPKQRSVSRHVYPMQTRQTVEAKMQKKCLGRMLQYILLNRALVDGCCMLGNQTSAVNTSFFRESGLSAICFILRETGLDPSAKPKALTLPCRPKHEHMRPRRRRRRPRSSPRPTARGLLLLFLLMLVVLLLLLLSLLLLVGAYTMGMGTQFPGAPCCCCCCYCCTKPLGSRSGVVQSAFSPLC